MSQSIQGFIAVHGESYLILWTYAVVEIYTIYKVKTSADNDMKGLDVCQDPLYY